MKGSVCHELEVDLPAGEIWEIYRTLRLAQLVVELLPDLFQKLEIEEGDGGVGTVLVLTLPPRTPGPGIYKEKFVKIDDEKRVKEAITLEGALMELGFLSYLVRFEIAEKDGESSVVKTTIEYEVEEEHAANASLVTTDTAATIHRTVCGYLAEEKRKKSGISSS